MNDNFARSTFSTDILTNTGGNMHKVMMVWLNVIHLEKEKHGEEGKVNNLT